MPVEALISLITLFIFCFTNICLFSQDLVIDYDGNEYRTVKIGEQVWMADNLKTTRDAHGGELERICYQYIEANCDTFGGLYAWNDLKIKDGVDKCQGICPDGWHIPSDQDWDKLICYLGGADSAAVEIRAHDDFNLQYGGNFHSRLHNFNYLDKNAYYWAATTYSHTAAWIRMIGRKNANINRSTVPKIYCLSVRCIKD